MNSRYVPSNELLSHLRQSNQALSEILSRLSGTGPIVSRQSTLNDVLRQSQELVAQSNLIIPIIPPLALTSSQAQAQARRLHQQQLLRLAAQAQSRTQQQKAIATSKLSQHLVTPPCENFMDGDIITGNNFTNIETKFVTFDIDGRRFCVDVDNIIGQLKQPKYDYDINNNPILRLVSPMGAGNIYINAQAQIPFLNEMEAYKSNPKSYTHRGGYVVVLDNPITTKLRNGTSIKIHNIRGSMSMKSPKRKTKKSIKKNRKY
jgi:hypothetical protein